MIQPNRLRRFVAVGACALALATGVGLLARSSAPRPAYANPLAAGDRIADTAERVVDSVVNISTTQAVARGPFAFDPFWNDPGSPSFGQADPRRASSLGSGVIVSTDGRVLTNAHVIGDAEAIRVTLRDGLELDATLIGADPKSDLAVLQLVPAKGQKLPALKPLPLGDSSKLRLGQVVLAVGNPFGVGQAVTMGIVSAVGRAGLGIEEYEDFIQTDAAINPGNSGGALVDLDGKLVGINTAILSRSGGYQGIGFAIPTNMASPIMDMLVKDGRVSRAYLGVVLQPLDADARARFQIKAPTGVVVARVEGDTPAAKAGLKPGDLVVGLDGQPVKELGRLRNTIAMRGVGKTVNLDVIRADKRQTVAVQLEALPETRPVRVRPARTPGRSPGQAAPAPSPGQAAPRWFREEVIVHPDGRVERKRSSSDDAPTP
jgi:serine protease Do